jgi:DNA-binding response OmpR family regulator
MAKPNILVIDSDEGFGLMLKEGLENSGHYHAKCVHTGSDALQSVVEENFDLVIVDMALTDMPPGTLIQAARDARNGVKIMVIPLIGQAVPKSIEALNINGVLTKPFFVGDLPDLIDQAIGRRRSSSGIRPVSQTYPVTASQPRPSETSPTTEKEPSAQTTSPEPVATEPAPEEITSLPMATVSPETIRFLRANEAETLRLLDDLNREVRAEAILLIAGGELIAQAGMLHREQCQELTMLVAQSSQAAAQAARFLGEPAGRFMQSLHEGDAYRLYSLTLSEGVLLSLALSSNVPLGMIRHQCRQIAEQLSKFII